MNFNILLGTAAATLDIGLMHVLSSERGVGAHTWTPTEVRHWRVVARAWATRNASENSSEGNGNALRVLGELALQAGDPEQKLDLFDEAVGILWSHPWGDCRGAFVEQLSAFGTATLQRVRSYEHVLAPTHSDLVTTELCAATLPHTRLRLARALDDSALVDADTLLACRLGDLEQIGRGMLGEESRFGRRQRDLNYAFMAAACDCLQQLDARAQHGPASAHITRSLQSTVDVLGRLCAPVTEGDPPLLRCLGDYSKGYLATDAGNVLRIMAASAEAGPGARQLLIGMLRQAGYDEVADAAS